MTKTGPHILKRLADIQTVGPGLWMAFILFALIRPLATMATLAGTSSSRRQRAFMAWFGVRGIGWVYYLAFAMSHGVAGDQARLLADITLVVVAASILVHGVSVTPLMQRYAAR